MIRWVVQDFTNSGYSPLERCKQVSARLQRFSDNGPFYITGRDNLAGYPVLCVTNTKGGLCSSNNVLVTLQPGTDPGVAVQRMWAFRRSADVKPIELSASQTVTYINGEFYLDVKQLLDAVDEQK